MPLSIVIALAILLSSCVAAGVISASRSRRSVRFGALSTTGFAAVMTLVVAGAELGGMLGRDAAARDNRSDAASVEA